MLITIEMAEYEISDIMELKTLKFKTTDDINNFLMYFVNGAVFY